MPAGVVAQRLRPPSFGSLSMVLRTALSMRSAGADQRLSQSPCRGCNREVQATLIGPGDICDRRTIFLVTAATTSRHFMVATGRLYDLRLIRPARLAWAASGSLCRV